jgi:ABC-type ATPase with predicted acetyltransferase domain
MPPSLTPTVRRLFDLPAGRADAPPRAPSQIVRAAAPRCGRVTLITGPSGGGKTSLLAQLRHAIMCNQVDLNDIALPRKSTVIDCVASRLRVRRRPADAPAAAVVVVESERDLEARIAAALSLLAGVGLAEARDYLRPPRRLSEGQRFRLRLALALATCEARRAAPGDASPTAHLRGRHVLICDEFAAPLDDLTAAVVARCVRRAVDARRAWLSAVVVTGRCALRAALAPDVVVHCDFDEWKVGA